ncbi:MAG: hypothetical protein HRT89_13365 [Lentisphaeria bacterium]|nr:hypothetical protein [Lentisphaeria bacterium]NQZ69046.1 hypothetical protein [Lentisphaeria bacterium]
MKLTHRLLVAMAAATIGTAEAAHICKTDCQEKTCIAKKDTLTAEQLKKKLTQAVINLGHKDRKIRKSASQMLIKSGKSSLPYLKKASKNKDPEISQTVKSILAIINKAKKKIVIIPRKDPCPACGMG